MPVKSWNPGDVLTASDMDVWTLPAAIIKPADTARNTTTTFADDPDLIVPVAASTTYHINGVIFYDGANMTVGTDPGGMKGTFTVPAGATGQCFVARQNAATTPVFAGAFTSNWGDTLNCSSQGTGLIMVFGISAILAIAGTAGNLTFRWAQVTSSATNTHVKAQSFLTAQRIA